MATSEHSSTKPDLRSATEPKLATQNVLHVINGEYYAGAERVQDLLAQELVTHGIALHFACTKPRLFPEKRIFDGAPIYDLKMKSRLDFGAAKRLRNLIKKGDFSIVHAHTPRTLFLCRIALRGLSVPLVYHVHSPAGQDSTHQFKNWINAKIEKWALKRADLLIGVSESLTKRYQRIVGPTKTVRLISNGVPTSERRVTGPSKGKPWLLGSVALIRPRKGIEILLKAQRLLLDRQFPVELRVVGPFETDEYEAEIKNLVRELSLNEKVSWAGFQRDVASEMKKFDLFVLPSLFGEGLPMVILEAMALGLPVISTEVEGIPEVISERIHGLLAEPSNANSLANAIEEVISEKLSWQTLSDNAYRQQRENFSHINMAEKLSAIYRHLLETNND
ncbi:MAG: glycosyltransferase [Pirellulaceae bacterium]|nr:glycosyltransferase [Pirellulaceae bacterium]